MKKQLILLTATATVIGGCVSSSDFEQVQHQITSLQSKVTRLEGQINRSNEEIAVTKGELAVVKEQRVVRLPTGAPTEMRNRKEQNAQDSTAQQYNEAISLYKSGDVNGAITAFEAFINNHPHAQQRNDALFYLGQAAYTSRDFLRAQQSLEPLVFQPINGKINEPAARLLQKVYQAQGNVNDESRLSEYMQTLSNPQPEASTVLPTNTEFNTPTSLTPLVQPSNTTQNTSVIIENTSPQPLRPYIQ